MTPTQHLIQLAMEQKRKTFPNVPEAYLVRPTYPSRSEGGLIKSIIDFIKLNGGQAERISNTGRPIDRRQIITDVVGRKRQVGSMKWIPGTGTNGTADISATVKGKSVKVEIKIGRDSQSDDQKNYEHSINAAGGIYIIAKTFADFHKAYYETVINEAVPDFISYELPEKIGAAKQGSNRTLSHENKVFQ
jgi:hypothetical protein